MIRYWCAWHPEKGFGIWSLNKSRTKTIIALRSHVRDKKLDSHENALLRITSKHFWEVIEVEITEAPEKLDD